jgi:hypothetical protein
LKLCRGYLVLIMMVWPTFNPRSKSYWTDIWYF